MELSKEGYDALVLREGRRRFGYPDPKSPLARAFPRLRWGFAAARTLVPAETLEKYDGKPWTCGIGQTGPNITMDTQWTDQEIERNFRTALVPYVRAVNRGIKVETAQNEFDAFVSFAYNVGTAGFLGSTALKAHNRGDREAAARALLLWNKPAMIIGRRESERLQYLETEEISPSVITALAPEPERNIARSEINIAAGAGIVSTIGATVGQVLDLVEGKEIYFLATVIILVLGYIIYQRVRQRKKGWA